MTIWKYTLTPIVTLALPQGAQILTVQMQKGDPQLWALVDPSKPDETRTFRIYGTGHTLTDNPGKYIATFQMVEGNLVFHVFETT